MNKKTSAFIIATIAITVAIISAIRYYNSYYPVEESLNNNDSCLIRLKNIYSNYTINEYKSILEMKEATPSLFICPVNKGTYVVNTESVKCVNCGKEYLLVIDKGEVWVDDEMKFILK